MSDQPKYQEGLSLEQVEFLQKHKIHPRYVFDGTGMNQAQYRPIMKELNKGVTFNVSACKEAGHTLRTRTGHCCQCDTTRLAFQTRHDSGGIVYIAGSVTGQTIKVGFTKAIEVRAESLNRTKYEDSVIGRLYMPFQAKMLGELKQRQMYCYRRTS